MVIAYALACGWFFALGGIWIYDKFFYFDE